jgi:hypothetical protein
MSPDYLFESVEFSVEPCGSDVVDDGAVWKGAVAGAVAGLAGAWAMNLFQSGLTKLTSESDGGGQEEQTGDDATMKTADAISERVAGRSLTHREKQVGGPVVHYAFGAAMGALYGAAVEIAPRSAAAWGTGFGTALWAAADEIGVPAVGLSGPPWETPISTHASALAAHLVYGGAVETVRRAVRLAL